jgi:hypothetical protein
MFRSERCEDGNTQIMVEFYVYSLPKPNIIENGLSRIIYIDVLMMGT